MNSDVTTEKLLTSQDVGQILALSKRTIHRFNSSGLIIRPLRISGSVRYVKSELMAWIASGMPKRSEWEARRAAEQC